jgi:hypothetical protein
MESRSCPETVPVGVPALWDVISPRPPLRSGRGPNQSCSPPRELSNAMSHSQSARRGRVDSRLLVVGSQIANLTPGPSFAHNLGYKCPNGQCEAIFDIYVSRAFQWHQERLNARCFEPCCRALNIRESRRTPIPQLFQVLGFTPTLGQSRVVTNNIFKKALIPKIPIHHHHQNGIKWVKRWEIYDEAHGDEGIGNGWKSPCDQWWRFFACAQTSHDPTNSFTYFHICGH